MLHRVKKINTILQIKDEEGETTHNFEEKARVVERHFQKRFMAPPGCPIQEILGVLNLFPCLITE